MIWAWVLALMTLAPSLGPLEALGMDALLATALCVERLRHLTDGGGRGAGGGGNVVDLPGGRRQIRIGSMDELAGLLKGGL